MAILTAHYSLDLAKLPMRDDKLRLRYSAQVVNGRNTLMLLHANSEPGCEPKYVRFMTGLTLKVGDRILAQGAGQLVLTSHRILGMITASGSPKPNVPSPVDAFAVDVADVTDPEGSSNWRGKAVQATVRSRDGLEPPFLIRIFSVGANVTNDGKVALTSLASLLGWMNDDGRRKLQGAT